LGEQQIIVFRLFTKVTVALGSKPSHPLSYFMHQQSLIQYDTRMKLLKNSPGGVDCPLKTTLTTKKMMKQLQHHALHFSNVRTTKDRGAALIRASSRTSTRLQHQTTQSNVLISTT
jgi:hypothetical protein